MPHIISKRWAIVWAWPDQRMAWFWWAHRNHIWPDTRWWRLGPLTFWLVD